MTTSTSPGHGGAGHHTSPGTTIPFDVVDTPGAYICDWSGHLLRVPEGAVAAVCSPAIHLVGSEPLTVTKISDDPRVPVRQAKRLAADFSVQANF